LIKIGDAAVSEQKVVETTPVSSPKEEKKAEKKSTSTKKAKSRGQSLAIKDLQQNKKDEENELDTFKSNIYIVFVECETPGNIGFLARTMAKPGFNKSSDINSRSILSGNTWKIHC